MSISKAPVILLIEDDPVGISSLAGILGDRVELVVCKTLTDARRLLTDEIDLILLDLYLPDGSGIEFLNYLKNQTDYESLPVMCISSSDRIQDIEQAFQHGATDYVLKPFNKTIISAKIATLVDLKRKTDQLAAAALSDPLTNIGNRRLFDRQLDSEWHRASRLNSFVGLILIDVDNFKQINDQLGHGQGDRCLQVLADTLSLRFARAGDITARLGGDEFAVIMPGANLKGTITAANTLLTLLHSSQSTTITTRRKTLPLPCLSAAGRCSRPRRKAIQSWCLGQTRTYIKPRKKEGAIVSDPLLTAYEGSSRSELIPGITPKVMIVDDEPGNISLLANALSNDYELVVATRAAEALALLDNNELPHLILLDIMMPDMSGLEMCQQLKRNRRLQHIPVIFITSLNDAAAEEQGFDAGGVDFIKKPIHLPAVRARVHTHISLRGKLDHMLSLHDELKKRVKKLSQMNWRLANDQKNLGQTLAAKELFESVFMATSEGIVLLDAQGLIIGVNSAFSRITGFCKDEVMGRSFQVLDKYSHQQGTSQQIFDHLRNNDHWSGEIYNRRKSGEVYPELRSISVTRSDEGEITHYISVFNDVSNLKETEQRLEELTWRDPVTGLPNRALFLGQLDTVLKFCKRGNVCTAVIVVDINNFRYINETLGFECGDRVIREFAKRLQGSMFEDDSIARLAGDEFGIALAPKHWDKDDAYRVILMLYERIQHCLVEPISNLAVADLRLEVTIGAALYPTDSSDTPMSALQHAETAHRSAKAEHKPIAIFQDSMSENIRRHLLMESELNRAIEQQELVLFAQPQFSPLKALSSLEVLVRWNHPERGIVGPGEFIPQAEQSRQIVKIERYVLEQALVNMVQLLAFHPYLRCSVNISAKHFAEDDFADTVVAIIEASGFPAYLLTLELTESVTVHDVATVVKKMDVLRQLGCEISLDDFGTGYSSLSQLQRLPITEVKIDRSFVLGAVNEPMSANIVEMVKRIGEAMGARVVAEGVETQAHADFLAHHHPDVYLQGYFFGVPKPMAEFMNHATEPPL